MCLHASVWIHAVQIIVLHIVEFYNRHVATVNPSENKGKKASLNVTFFVNKTKSQGNIAVTQTAAHMAKCYI